MVLDSVMIRWSAIIFYSFFSISINKLAILDYFGRNDASVGEKLRQGIFFISVLYT